jgi:ribosome biogenesis GTPase
MTHNSQTTTQEGLVFKKLLGKYFVRAAEQTFDCSISSRLRKQLIYPIAAPTDPKRRGKRVQNVKDIGVVDPVAIGDRVSFIEADHGRGVITDVLPRRNKLVRPTAEEAGKHPLEQVIVANVDQVAAVFPVHPAPKWHLLDRHLAMAEAAGIPALICLTKLDLAGDVEALEAIAGEYRRIGYPPVLTSAVDGAGLEALKEALRGKLSALIGKSGAGKTTLLNAIQPGLGLRINAVNARTGEGKHTTTHLEMFDLDFGGSVVDTPGLRLFKLWDVPPDALASLLPEMRPYLGQCQFGLDCTHSHEPGCAIKAEVKNGGITVRRYESYLDMKEYFYDRS